MYSSSVAMIAGVFCPRKLVATSNSNKARLAAISIGGTVITNAASYAAAAALAWAPACSACPAVSLIHDT
jgi:hypothetical protein